MNWFSFHFQDFAYSFLSILFEGIPFLLLGSLISGAVDAFVPASTMTRLLPGNSGVSIVLSGLLGVIFPMCECGSVVIVRRFIKKGLPVSCAITYMLAAPSVNPIVALSTFAAFRGQSPWVMMTLRVSLGFLLSLAIGFITRQIPQSKFLQKKIIDSLPGNRRAAFSISAMPGGAGDLDLEGAGSFRPKLQRAMQAATSDFLDVAFFLVIGAAIASVFNTAVNQTLILPFATSTALSTFAMMVLAFCLALCSTSDAFIAASFVSFPFVAKLAFLVFDAMFNVKLWFLYGLVFRRWFVVCLLVGLFVVIGVICIRLSVLHL